jgi:hypothetical protein
MLLSMCALLLENWPCIVCLTSSTNSRTNTPFQVGISCKSLQISPSAINLRGLPRGVDTLSTYTRRRSAHSRLGLEQSEVVQKAVYVSGERRQVDLAAPLEALVVAKASRHFQFLWRQNALGVCWQKDLVKRLEIDASKTMDQSDDLFLQQIHLALGQNVHQRRQKAQPDLALEPREGKQAVGFVDAIQEREHLSTQPGRQAFLLASLAAGSDSLSSQNGCKTLKDRDEVRVGHVRREVSLALSALRD